MKFPSVRVSHLVAGLGALLLISSFGAAQAQYRDRDRYGDRGLEGQVLSKMHSVDQFEIDMGRLAMDRGSSQAVRDFGRRLRRDHMANDRLVISIARQENIDLTRPASMETDHDRRVRDDLESRSGRDFDRAFVMAMARGHQGVLQELRQDREQLPTGRVRSLVTSTIPAIRSHERIARNLEGRL